MPGSRRPYHSGVAMHPGRPGGDGDPAPEGGRAADRRTESAPTAAFPRSHAARRYSPPLREVRRRRLIQAGFALGLIGLIASLVGVASNVLPRSFTPGQQQRITTWEISKRWRTWPADRIFPAAVPYQLQAQALDSPAGVRLTARRAGIAPQAGCAAVTDPVAARILGRFGCTAVLRATYQDSTGAFVVTVGVAVLPGTRQASAAVRALPHSAAPEPGLRPFPLRHTVLAGFSNAARWLSTVRAAGTYVVMSTVGYTDGRHYDVHESADPYDKNEMLSVAEGITSWVAGKIGAPPPPPRCPGTPAC